MTLKIDNRWVLIDFLGYLKQRGCTLFRAPVGCEYVTFDMIWHMIWHMSQYGIILCSLDLNRGQQYSSPTDILGFRITVPRS